VIELETWDGVFMLRKDWASSRLRRVGVLGLFAATTAMVFTVDSAEARRSHQHRHSAHHHSRHSDDKDNYSPQFSSIIVDANSGATLASTSPDGLRHPASLTKIMTLYLLFERLDAGRMKLDTEMSVSQHASDQAPTKLDLRPGTSIKVEDAIKGLVTRSANDAAVVIAETIGGSEDDFAKLMTRKARALGMSRTTYRNASGLPDDEQVTTARDQATLGRAIQDRFPRYYRYFSTLSFNYHGESIRNHNHLLGQVEGVDGIKTGYTRASGFNLVTSMRRGNRHLVGVVMGGRSGGSRDAIMRGLLAENLDKAASTRTVAAISDRNALDDNTEIADAEPSSKPNQMVQIQGAVQSLPDSAPAARAPTAASRVASAIAQATAALPAKSDAAKADAEPPSSGVIQSRAMNIIPGSSEPMKPVRVKTVQVKAGPMKLAAAGPDQPVAQAVAAMPPARNEVPETSSAVMAKIESGRAEIARPDSTRSGTARVEMPPQPAGFGTGNGVLGVLPASSLSSSASPQALAYAPPQSQAQPSPAQQQAAAQPINTAKPAIVRTGWIVQVGALESEGEAQQRIEAARNQARGLLNKADPFTETVVAKDNRTLFRARFAGLDHDQAEAVCRALKRSDMSCMTVHN
jgi:D-alanyl-D-alanine carboxypeptidase